MNEIATIEVLNYGSCFCVQASERFEAAAKGFMLETLRLAKALRPKALWGYYGFPFCFNNKPVGRSMPCSKEVFPENNRYLPLFMTAFMRSPNRR